MKFRTTFAALAAVAALSLAACGSDDTAGEPSAPSVSAPADTAPADSAPAESAPTGSDAAGSEAAGSEAAGSDAAGSESAGSDGAGAPVGGAGACQGVLDILQDLPGLLTKVTSGGVTQEDVDGVFTEERMSSLPEDLVEPINTIKDQATGLVGKDQAEAAEALGGMGSSVQDLAGKVKSACTG